MFEDSTGKRKIADTKARNKSLIAIFVVGLCVGLVIAERVYITRGGRVPKPRFLRTEHDRHLQLAAGESAGPHIDSAAVVDSGRAASTLPAGGKPGGTTPDSTAVVAGALLTASSASTLGEPRNALEALLRRIAPSREVLVAVANKNVNWDGMLATFCSGLKRAGVTNHLIMALDMETKEWAEKNGFNAYLMQLQIHKAQAGTGDNHAVSAMKFGILKQVVELGWAVLLSDVDIAVLQNPFNFLYRDSDVEGMTDGFDVPTAYGAIDGFDDPSMGWARFAQLYKHFNLNSGLFYLLANQRTLDLLQRLETRLSKTKYWDQTAYNEEIFFLSHGGYKSPQVSVRVMEIDKFMNSKRLFKIVRHLPPAQRPPMPVMVHINYHPDKHQRMKAVIQYYVGGDSKALDPFPGGSEQGT